MINHTTWVGLTADGELEVCLELESPGEAPSGMSGPPENYDPGCGPEWVVVGFRLFDVELPQKSVEELVMALMQTDLSAPYSVHLPEYSLLAKLRGQIEEAESNAEEPEVCPED